MTTQTNFKFQNGSKTNLHGDMGTLPADQREKTVFQPHCGMYHVTNITRKNS